MTYIDCACIAFDKEVLASATDVPTFHLYTVEYIVHLYTSMQWSLGRSLKTLCSEVIKKNIFRMDSSLVVSMLITVPYHGGFERSI